MSGLAMVIPTHLVANLNKHRGLRQLRAQFQNRTKLLSVVCLSEQLRTHQRVDPQFTYLNDLCTIASHYGHVITRVPNIEYKYRTWDYTFERSFSRAEQKLQEIARRLFHALEPNIGVGDCVVAVHLYDQDDGWFSLTEPWDFSGAARTSYYKFVFHTRGLQDFSYSQVDMNYTMAP